MKVKQNMNVVWDSIESVEETFLIVEYAVDIGVEFPLMFLRDGSFTIFRCENDMYQASGLAHGIPRAQAPGLTILSALRAGLLF